jgi:nitrate reductase NapE component
MSLTQSQATTETKKKASFFQVMKAVLWSMLGVRQHKGYENDAAKITLKQAVIAGLIGGFIFVVTMLTVVRLVISQLGQ